MRRGVRPWSERGLLQRLDGRAVRLQRVGQRVGPDDLLQRAILVRPRTRRLARVQLREPVLLGLLERVEQRLRDPRRLCQHLVLHHDRAVHRIDAGAAIIVRLQLLGIREQVGVIRLDLLPAAGRRAGAADPRRRVEPRRDRAPRHHVGQAVTRRNVLDVVGELHLLDVLLVVDPPGDLVVVDAELVDQHLARPHAGGDRIGAHAGLLALKVLGRADPRVGPDEQPRMVEAAHDEDRQRDERLPVGARDDVGRRRDLADVELQVAHHPAERADLRLHRDELGLDALDRDLAGLDRHRMRMIRDRDLQFHLLGQGSPSCCMAAGPCNRLPARFGGEQAVRGPASQRRHLANERLATHNL